MRVPSLFIYNILLLMLLATCLVTVGCRSRFSTTQSGGAADASSDASSDAAVSGDIAVSDTTRDTVADAGSSDASEEPLGGRF